MKNMITNVKRYVFGMLASTVVFGVQANPISYLIVFDGELSQVGAASQDSGKYSYYVRSVDVDTGLMTPYYSNGVLFDDLYEDTDSYLIEVTIGLSENAKGQHCAQSFSCSASEYKIGQFSPGPVFSTTIKNLGYCTNLSGDNTRIWQGAQSDLSKRFTQVFPDSTPGKLNLYAYPLNADSDHDTALFPTKTGNIVSTCMSDPEGYMLDPHNRRITACGVKQDTGAGYSIWPNCQTQVQLEKDYGKLFQ